MDAATGIITTVGGQGVNQTGDNIPATSARLRYVPCIACDAANNLFLAQGGDRIRKIVSGADGFVTGAPDELVSTVAGTLDVRGLAGDGGPAANAVFNVNVGLGGRLALDADGSLFVVEGYNQRVRKIARIGTPTDAPPVADAGDGFSVNEAQQDVPLDGSGSSDPDNDPLTYFWTQVAGPTVTLTGDSTASPTFDAPLVARRAYRS